MYPTFNVVSVIFRVYFSALTFKLLLKMHYEVMISFKLNRYVMSKYFFIFFIFFIFFLSFLSFFINAKMMLYHIFHVHVCELILFQFRTIIITVTMHVFVTINEMMILNLNICLYVYMFICLYAYMSIN